MKSRCLTAILLLALLPSLQASALQEAAEEIRIQRLAGLGRLWGAVRYFHPATAAEEVDWDRALIEAIPRVNQAGSTDEYRAAVEQMLSLLNDPATTVMPQPLPSFDQAPDAERQPYSQRLPDGVAIVWASAYDHFSSSDKEPAFQKAFQEACPADLTLLDLRKRSQGFAGEWRLPQLLRSALPACLDHPVALSVSRRRKHSGYPPQERSSSGGYWTGFEMSQSELLPSQLEAGQAGRLVVLINAGTPSNLVPLLGGLQTGANAKLIYVGEEVVQEGESSYQMELPEGLEASIRLSEWINPNGSSGLRPDLMIEDKPLSVEEMVALARQALDASPPEKEPSKSFWTAKGSDRAYRESPFPTVEYRLLGLFRFWNVFHYFSPNKQHLDRPWEEALIEMIPRFEAASDATEYALAASELSVRTQDSHSFVFSSRLSDYFGRFQPPLTVWPVQGQTVVVRIAEPSKAAGIELGDVVLEVDGNPVAKRLDELGRYMAASTPQALSVRAHRSLLAGPENSEVLLKLAKADGTTSEARLPRGRFNTRWPREGKVWRMLDEGFGYMDLARLQRNQVYKAFDELREAPALIFDMRGYPNGTAWVIAPFLTEKSVPAALFRRPEPSTPDPDWDQSVSFVQPTGGPAERHYKGEVVVLIDGRAISQAEHTCLFIEAATQGKAVFIGSATNGANGDVTDIVLPGGISMMMTGHNVRHADGRPLQRVGIQPDIHVEPSIEGIRRGRDEVLEAAIEFLRKGEGISRQDAKTQRQGR